MAKYTDQDIPPELVAAYERLISNGVAGVTASGTSRIRTAATRPQRLRKAPYVVRRLSAMVDVLCKRLGLDRDSQSWKNRHFTELEKLLKGEIDPDIWIACTRIASAVLSAAPASVPDPDPPAYAYRDIGNLPTLPTYPLGVEVGGNPLYNGTWDEGYFKDDLWNWARTVFMLIEEVINPSLVPAFYFGGLEYEIDTDQRASKPIFSALTMPHFAVAGDAILSSNVPPREEAISLYWRYRIPESESPFYHLNYSRRVMILPRLGETFPPDEPADRAVLTIGPRPMFGRGFNNNSSVSVQMQESVDLYQMHPCIGKAPQPVVRDAAGKYALYNTETGVLTPSPHGPVSGQLSQGGHYLLQMVGIDDWYILENNLQTRRQFDFPYGPTHYPLEILPSGLDVQIAGYHGMTYTSFNGLLNYKGGQILDEVFSDDPFVRCVPWLNCYPIGERGRYLRWMFPGGYWGDGSLNGPHLVIAGSTNQLINTTTGVWYFGNVVGDQMPLCYAGWGDTAPTIVIPSVASNSWLTRYKSGGCCLFRRLTGLNVQCDWITPGGEIRPLAPAYAVWEQPGGFALCYT
jgi:hypothetical protein